jgi:hypothetical protein
MILGMVFQSIAQKLRKSSYNATQPHVNPDPPVAEGERREPGREASLVLLP